MTPTPAHLSELTSIRAVAALSVVLFHIFFSENNTPGFLNNLIADGHLGVDFFFMLSGFILTHVYLAEWRTGEFSYRNFLVNRLARVYPLHLVMIILMLLAYQMASVVGVNSIGEGRNWAHLPWHILALHAWGFTDGHSWNFPSWSISAEAFSYILFPLILTTAMRLKALTGLGLAVIFFWIASLVAVSQLGQPLTKLMYNFGILRVIVEFNIGVFLYLVLERYRLPENFVKPLILISVTTVIILSGVVQADERIIVLVMGVLLFSLAQRAQMPQNGILRHPFLIYLGEISYATYMIHILVIIVANSVGSKIGLPAMGFATVALILIGVYLGSVILYHLVEHPGRKILRKAFKSNHRA